MVNPKFLSELDNHLFVFPKKGLIDSSLFKKKNHSVFYEPPKVHIHNAPFNMILDTENNSKQIHPQQYTLRQPEIETALQICFSSTKPKPINVFDSLCVERDLVARGLLQLRLGKKQFEKEERKYRMEKLYDLVMWTMFRKDLRYEIFSRLEEFLKEEAV